jgi:hypothetical protein
MSADERDLRLQLVNGIIASNARACVAKLRAVGCMTGEQQPPA